MDKKVLGVKSLFLCFCILIGCTTKKANKGMDNDYLGHWEIQIKEMPKVGDVSFDMNILGNDSVYNGYFVELNGDTVFFNKVELVDGCLNTEYEWGGHEVGFKVKFHEGNKNILEGSFMRFFDIEGRRK